jgi:hypothetical protein
MCSVQDLLQQDLTQSLLQFGKLNPQSIEYHNAPNINMSNLYNNTNMCSSCRKCDRCNNQQWKQESKKQQQFRLRTPCSNGLLFILLATDDRRQERCVFWAIRHRASFCEVFSSFDQQQSLPRVRPSGWARQVRTLRHDAK